MTRDTISAALTGAAFTLALVLFLWPSPRTAAHAQFDFDQRAKEIRDCVERGGLPVVKPSPGFVSEGIGCAQPLAE